ncbi:MAG: NAD(P)/FAD-dependent oxidoreductase [Candidatus Nitrosotalea sp.]|nr:NAD(P)/FAD-dependent oxidoreductase [Candidatus Nitrosotalea sp.]
MTDFRVDFSLRKEVSFVALSSILGAFAMFVPSTLLDISAGKDFYLSWLVFAKIVGSNSIIVGILIHVVVATIIGIISGIILYRGKILNISKISNGVLYGIMSGTAVLGVFFIPVYQFLLAPNMTDVIMGLDPHMTYLEASDLVQKGYSSSVIMGIISHLIWGITVGVVSSILTVKFGARFRCKSCDIQFLKIKTYEHHVRYIHETKSRSMKHILILGGGFGGIHVLRLVQQAFEDDVDVFISLVSEDNFFLFTPMLPEISSGTIEPRHIATPVRTFCKRAKFYESKVDSIDLRSKNVEITRSYDMKKKNLDYDYLVLALGSKTNFFGNKNVEDNAMTIKTLDDAMEIRNHIITMLENADQEDDESLKNKFMTFVVVGGGFSGVEVVSELNDFVRESVEYFYRNIDSDKIKIILVNAGQTILPEVGEDLGQFASEEIIKAGVEIISNTKVVDAGQDFVTLGNNTTIHCKTFIWAGGVAVDPVISALDCEHDKIGKVKVDENLRLVGYQNVYSLGDCASILDSNTQKPYPPTAQHAIRQAKVVANNLISDIQEKKNHHIFSYKTKGTMAKIGKNSGVAILLGHKVRGTLAYIIWRWYYLTNLPTRGKMLRVALDWLADSFMKKDITRLRNLDEASDKHKIRINVS